MRGISIILQAEKPANSTDCVPSVTDKGARSIVKTRSANRPLPIALAAGNCGANTGTDPNKNASPEGLRIPRSRRPFSRVGKKVLTYDLCMLAFGGVG